MRTLGVDFAAQPKNTTLCEIVWDGTTATIVEVAGNVTDDQIRTLVAGPPSRVIGVNVPFGWPIRFVQFVQAHQSRVTPPVSATMAEFRLRETDRYVGEVFKKHPLSVSTDRIGMPALRWAQLLDEFGVTSRAGDGQFYEVSPALARRVWGLDERDDAAALDVVAAQCPIAFTAAEQRDTLLRNKHAFDALLCSLIARAAALGLTVPPPAELRVAAEVEGWIHAPQPASLAQLIAIDPPPGAT
ncbi:MAG: DUF429 domain-containing protein [Thermomicrobiales bacterium]|nr:DUF429 domain-containing protein [Thermomicrobiales bacterium]